MKLPRRTLLHLIIQNFLSEGGYSISWLSSIFQIIEHPHSVQHSSSQHRMESLKNSRLISVCSHFWYPISLQANGTWQYKMCKMTSFLNSPPSPGVTFIVHSEEVQALWPTFGSPTLHCDPLSPSNILPFHAKSSLTGTLRVHKGGWKHLKEGKSSILSRPLCSKVELPYQTTPD